MLLVVFIIWTEVYLLTV